MRCQPADALLLSLGHGTGIDARRQAWSCMRLADENVRTALRFQRLLKAQVQSFGPPKVESNAIRRRASRSIFAPLRETALTAVASEIRALCCVFAASALESRPAPLACGGSKKEGRISTGPLKLRLCVICVSGLSSAGPRSRQSRHLFPWRKSRRTAIDIWLQYDRSLAVSRP